MLLVTFINHVTENYKCPFANHVKCPCVIFDERIMYKMHIETITAKAFRTVIRAYPLFKCKRLIANINIIFHTTLRSVMTCLPYLDLRGRHVFPRRILTRALYVIFKIRYVCGFITQLCR